MLKDTSLKSRLTPVKKQLGTMAAIAADAVDAIDAIDSLFDEAIEQSNGFDFVTQDQPHKEIVNVEDTAGLGGPLRLDQQPWRSLDGLRGVFHLFDQHIGVDMALSAEALVDSFLASGTSGLPDVLQPRTVLPLGTKVGMVAESTSPGKLDVVLHYVFADRVERRAALALASGECCTVRHRPGGNGMRKGLTLMMSRIVGVHAQTATLKWKSANLHGQDEGPARGPVTKGWRPSAEQLSDGMKFINKHFQEGCCEDPNFGLRWSLENRLVTEDSPIYGWPKDVVKEAMTNASKPATGADFETFYPLVFKDFKDVFKHQILPKLLPYVIENGLFIAGWPGIGKTQFAKALARLVGEYWIAERELEGCVGGWRRSKKLEHFKNYRQRIFETWMLDDPELSILTFEAIKDFFELTEAGAGHGRYHDARYTLNAMKILLTNELDFDSEPDPGMASEGKIDPTAFWAMVKPTFGRLQDAHRLAIFKRCISVVGGKKSLLLRLPSEKEDGEVFYFKDDGIEEDWLKEDQKDFLALHRRGVHRKYPGHDEAFAQELEWAKPLIEKIPLRVAATTGVAEAERADVFSRQVPPTPASSFSLGNSQSVSIRADTDGQYRFSGGPPAAKGSTMRSRFVFPGSVSREAVARDANVLATHTEEEQIAHAIAESQQQARSEEQVRTAFHASVHGEEILLNHDGSLSLPGGPAGSRAVSVRIKGESTQDAHGVKDSVHPNGIIGHKELSDMGTISIDDSPPKKRFKKCQDEKTEEDHGKDDNFGVVDVLYSGNSEDDLELVEEESQDEDMVAALEESLRGEDE
jgi:hypothetical protein